MQFDLKEFQGILFELLTEFDRVCKKYDIKYSLSFGTLLGAVRHKGFIPWDDDVDVMMTREEYDKYVEAMKKEKNDLYFFQTKETDSKYPYNIARLRKNNTAMIYENWENSGIHQGIYIDIYPIDKLHDNKFKRALQKALIIVGTPVRISQNREIFFGGAKSYSNKLKKILYVISKILPSRLMEKIETKAIVSANKTNAKKAGIIFEGGVLLKTPRDLIPFNSACMDDYTYLEFEGRNFMVCKNYVELLEGWYGDYMQLPPEEDRVMYHHPKYYSTEESYLDYLRARGE